MVKSSKFSENISSLTGITSYEAGITQASAYRAIKKITDAALSAYDVTTTQWFIIGAVYDRGDDGISVTELSQILGTNLPFITNSVNALEHRGIISRSVHNDNGRLKLLKIDPQYREKVPEIEAVVREALRISIYSTVSQKDFLTYIRVLYLFNEQLK